MTLILYAIFAQVSENTESNWSVYCDAEAIIADLVCVLQKILAHSPIDRITKPTDVMILYIP